MNRLLQLFLWGIISYTILPITGQTLRPGGLNVCSRSYTYNTYYRVTRPRIDFVRYRTCCERFIWCTSHCYRSRSRIVYYSVNKLKVKTSVAYSCCPGWARTGQECPNAICRPSCQNGDCVAPNKCKCKPGFAGKYCEQESLQPGCGIKGPSHTRIVGGVMAKPGDWPWMVNFDYKHNYANPGHHCGGSLITDEWILSAAHCFYSDLDKSKYWLVLGQHDIRTNTSYEQRIPIADILLHPKYDHSTYDYDHALVKLSRKATITDRVKTICLPDHNTSFPVGTKCFVTGWGLLSHAGRGPKILRQAQVPIVDQKVCKAAHHAHLVSNKMMCAGYAAGGIDSCQGDSGGPLYCKAKDGTWFINGVVSWGVGCGGANSYGVYARTKVLRPWVDQTVFKTS